MTDNEEARKYAAFSKEVDALIEKYGLTYDRDRDIIMGLMNAQFYALAEAIRLQDLVNETI